MNRLRKKLCEFGIAYFLMLILYLHACASEHVQTQMVGPGIQLRVVEVPEVPWQIRVLIVDLKNPYVHLETVKGNEHLFSLERTSSMANRKTYTGHVVVGAVNGDFFITSGPTLGQPVGTQVSNGQILLKPNWNTAFVVDTSGLPIIDVFTMQAEVLASAGNVNISAINITRGNDELILYNPFYGTHTGTDASGVELICSYLDSAFFVNDTIAGVVLDKKEGTGNAEIPEDGFVLSGSGSKATFLDNTFNVGDTIRYYILFPQVNEKIIQAVGGGPILIRDGNIIVDPGGAVHPRTAAGYSTDGDTLILMVVDGRQEGYSMGMTLYQVAEFMQEMGADFALNLDGGGSSTMVVRGEVVNSPSDPWGERPVTNSLQVISTAPTGSVQYLTIQPQIRRIFRGKQVQFDVSGLDQFYNPLNLSDSLVLWNCTDGLGSISSDGLFTAGTHQDTGYIICEISGIMDSLPIIVDTLKGINVIPSPLVMSTGDSLLIEFEGISTADSIVNIPFDSLRLEIKGERAVIKENGVVKAVSPGLDTLIVKAFRTISYTPIYIDVDSLDILIDDFSDISRFHLSVSGIQSFYTYIKEDTEVYVSPPGAMRLKYFFLHTGGSHRVDISREIVIPGSISSMSMDIYGNGKGHSIYWILEDKDGEIFNYYLVTSEDWGRQWQHVEKPIMYIIPSYENVGARLDFPIRLKSLTVYLGGGVPNQTEIDSLYFDNLELHYRPAGTQKDEYFLPETFDLGNPYPNPFNPSTRFSYFIPQKSHVRISVFDLKGRLIRVLVDGLHSPGTYNLEWNGTDRYSKTVSSGIYFIVATDGKAFVARKVLYLK